VKLDDAKLQTTLKQIHTGALAAAEAAAIVDVARFAASVDGRMDMGEMATVARLSKIIYEMSGGQESPVPSTPMPDGWLAQIGTRLATSGPRELAYAAARLIIIADRKITKEEVDLGVKLGEALHITPARTQQLDALIDALAQA